MDFGKIRIIYLRIFKRDMLIRLSKTHRIFIYGFLFGAFIAPFLSTLSLLFSFFEKIRFILIGPIDITNSIIPNIQTNNTYYIPIYKWIISLGLNGLYWSLIFYTIYKLKTFIKN